MSVIDQSVVGCEWESVNSWSPTWRWSGTAQTVSGVTSPSSRAADTVITLLTEPGSYTVVRPRLLLEGA